MGATCDTCCSTNPHQRIIQNTEVYDDDWADAVKTNKMAGIKILFQMDPDLVNETVDIFGSVAIHYAVKNQNSDLIKYLCENGANVDVQGGPNYNSALHEAVLIKDFQIIRQLFYYKINEKLKNNDGKLAVQLLPKKLKREFTKARNYSKRGARCPYNKEEKHEPVRVGDIILDQASHKTIRKYVDETDDQQNFYRKKEIEIKDREIPLTSFGEEVGLEVDEIAMITKNCKHLLKVWDKFAKKGADTITKQTQIFKLLFSLTVLALKAKNRKARQPPKKNIQDLTRRLCKILPKKKGKNGIEKSVFLKEFHTYLFKIHDKMVAEELNM